MIETTDQHKSLNLHNSAVLKMLEEEEGEIVYPGYKKVAWPPVSEGSTPVKASTPQPQQPLHQGDRSYYSQPTQPQYPQQYGSQSPQKQQHQQPAQYYQQQHQLHQQSSPFQQSSPYQQPPPQPQSSYQQLYHSPTYQQYNRQHSDPSQGSHQSLTAPSSTLSFSGGVPQKSPLSQPRSPSPQISSKTPRGWSHVPSSTPARVGYVQGPPKFPSGTTQLPFGSEPHFGLSQYQHPSEQQYQSSPVGHQTYSQQTYHSQQQPQEFTQPQPQYYPQAQSQQEFERGQSPGIITLRREPPITQKPAPVVSSQPAAARFKGGANMRGDLKWPPPEVKAQMQAEKEHEREIAMGPALKPRRVNKDYTKFFAKHALNSTYPGYKVPPGTQHAYVQF